MVDMKARIKQRAWIKRRHSIANKWNKTVLLNREPSIRRHIPQTKRFGGNTLQTMLNRYKMVYVKPVRGAKGIGVMRAEQHTGSTYSLHSGLKLTRHLSWQRFDQLVRKHISNKPYLVQRGIHMLRYKKRIFDLRISVQLDQHQNWQITGMLARLASPGRAVTNGSQGATIHTLQSVLRAYGSNDLRLKKEAQLRSICLEAATYLRRTYPQLNELGFDIALDKQLRPWILEVNTAPDAIPFSRLADRSMYRRILHYRKQNT